MTQYFQNAYLPGDSFNVGLLHDLALLEGFDCNLLAGGDVGAQTDLSERALPDGLACIVDALPTRYCPSVNYELIYIRIMNSFIY